MKNYTQIVVRLLLIGLCLSYPIVGQNPRKQNTIEIAEPFDIRNYAEWQKKDFYDFSIYVPKDLKGKTERGIDTSSWIAKNEKFELYVYQGSHPPNSPSSRQREFFGFEEKDIFINGIFSQEWKYDDVNNNYKYIREILFFNDAVYKNYRAYLVFSFNDKSISELADKIFHSLVFNNTSDRIKEK